MKSTKQNARRLRTKDFRLEDHNSIFLVFALTPAANEWVEAHLPDNPTIYGPGIAVERGAINDVVRSILADGLEIDEFVSKAAA